MSIETVIDECIQLSISLSLENDDLRVQAAPGTLNKALVARLTANKPALINWLQNRAQDKISPREASATDLPLSYSQRRLWVIDNLENDTSHFNVVGAFRLQGNIEQHHVKQAFSNIVARHEILRTRFESQNSVENEHAPIQIVSPEGEFHFQTEHLGDIEEDFRWQRIKEAISKEYDHNFNLSLDPLFRVVLLQESAESLVCIINMHHIISDGWSIKIMISEFWHHFNVLQTSAVKNNAGKSTTQATLPPLPLQYADFALWQQQQLAGERRQQLLEFWEENLSDLPEVHQLPTSFPRPAQQSFAAANHQFSLRAQEFKKLKQLCQQYNITLFVALQTIFAIQLALLSNEDDIVIGVPSAGRDKPELENLIGFFINMLVFRTRVDGQLSFEELLQKNQSQYLDIMSHQDMPFDALVEKLNPARSLAYSPLFQIKFMVQNKQYLSVTSDGIQASEIATPDTSIRFDLDLSVSEFEQHADFLWTYKTELFSADSISKMANGFRSLIAKLTACPTLKVRDLNLMSEEDKRAMLQLSLGQSVKAATNSAFQHWGHQFEELVEQHGDRLALRSEQLDLTYRELNKKANLLADQLQEEDIEPGTRVVLYLHKSAAVLIAMLAVGKCRGVFIPLDPKNARERFNYVVEDSDAELIISTTSLAANLPGNTADVLYIDGYESRDWLKGYRDNNPQKVHKPDDSAYVIYTSGSTGMPKGVDLSHHCLADYLSYAGRKYYSEQLVGSQVVTSHSFDITLPALLLPLTKGGIVELTPDTDTLPALASRLHAEQLSVNTAFLLRMTPVHLLGLLALFEGQPAINTPHVFVIGGDKFPVNIAQQLQNQFPRAQIYNHYGPTETTIGCSLFDVSGKLDSLTDVIPIGTPMDNQQLLVLGKQQQLLSKGMTGELFIGGTGVAKGYLNQERTNTEKFIANPYGEGRLYATGDLVRWNVAGQLEFVGRNDAQVKVRGFRVELGEIEKHLASLDGVKQAAIVFDNEQLRGFYVADDLPEGASREKAPQTDEILSALSQVLPAYMVPHTLQCLDAMPHSPNGKVDRKALSMSTQLTSQSSKQRAPHGHVETGLLSVWCDVLQQPSINVCDNFFSIGGDSIQAIQIVAKCAKKGLHFTTRDLFEHQSIAKLADHVSEKRPYIAEQEATTGNLQLLPVQRYFLDQNVSLNHYNQVVMLTLPVDTNISELRNVMETLIARHDALRLRFPDCSGAEYMPLTQALLDQIWHVKSLPIATSEALETVANQQQQKFDITKGPVVSLTAIISNDAVRLLWVCHHLIVDGVSWRIMLGDLATLWQQQRHGQTLQLPEKTSSLQQWGNFLAASTDATEIQQQIPFWQQQTHKIVKLPRNGLVPSDIQSTEIVTTLSAETTGQLLNKAGTPLRMQINELLLCGVFMGLQEVFGNDSFSFLMEGHGREDLTDTLNVSETVGWFTSKFPLTLTSGSDDILEIAANIKEQHRGVPQNGIGFGILKAYSPDTLNSGSETEFSNPSPDICFNYLGQFDQTLDGMDGISVDTANTGNTAGTDFVSEQPLMITGSVVKGQMSIALRYQHGLFGAEKAEHLQTSICSSLRRIAATLSDYEGKMLTPVDIPLVNLVQEELTQLNRDYALEDIYPAMGSQIGMLYHSQLSSDAYVNQMLVTLSNLNVDIFCSAWQQVFQQHPALRTCFYLSQTGYQQLVIDSAAPAAEENHLSIELLDISAKSLNEQDALIQQMREADRQQGFDVAIAPMMRLTLYKLSDHEYRLLWSHHHALWDGWCNSLLFKDLLTSYKAILEGTKATNQNQYPYRDYIQWLQQQDHTAAKQYWQNYLSDVSDVCQLPVQHNSNDIKLTRYLQSIDASTTSALKQLAKDNRCTLSTLFQGAWAYLLSSCTNEEQVVFGTVVSGRPAELPGADQMVGLFINTLPTKVLVDTTSSTTEWLQEIHAQHRESEAMSFLPLIEIQECCNIKPLFDSVLVVENFPVDEAFSAGSEELPFNVVNAESFDETHYGATLVIDHAADAINLRLDVNTARISDTLASKLLNYFSNILNFMANSPQQSISECCMLTDAEVAWFIEEFNATEADLSSSQPLYGPFLTQAIRTPGAIALTDHQGVMTYGELLAAAFAVTEQLEPLNIGIEELIGVRLPKGRKQVIACLSIMMAGGAYLPMEISWPTDRCASVTEKGRCRYMLVEDMSMTVNGVSGILLTENSSFEAQIIATAKGHQPRQTPENLAYVIFTSGSTGQPKGVAIEHHAALNTVLDVNQRYDISSDDKVLAVSALSFDLSVYDIFGLLAAGGEIVFPDADRATDPSHWLELVEQHNVTLWDTVPVSASLLVEQLEHRGRRSSAPIRNLVMSGDWIDPALPARLWNVFPGVRIDSMGGATEGSIWSIFYPIVEDTTGRKSVPYGRPMSNQTLYILNRYLQPVPKGVTGELCIGGQGVARCYFGDETLSKNRFVPHKALNENLYLTGDLVRMMPCDYIEFIGRTDHQVKINGFRIELGEIEQKLCEQDMVNEALVIAREDQPGNLRLVAYLLPSDKNNIEDGETQAQLIARTRTSLQASLPIYMVPAVYVFLDKWPLSSNGKVDIKALPASDMQGVDIARQGPETETEEVLMNIVSELFEASAEQISVTSSLVDLGGNSLVVIRLVSRIEQHFSLKLDLRLLYQLNSIRAIAEVLDRNLSMIDLDSTQAEMEQDLEEFSL